MKSGESGNQPEVRFQFGGVSASVFANVVTRADQSTFVARKTVLQRTYIAADGSYQTTGSFDVSDLPKAILALEKAFEYCLTGRRQESGPEESES